jgi:hypothetical protein
VTALGPLLLFGWLAQAPPAVAPPAAPDAPAPAARPAEPARPPPPLPEPPPPLPPPYSTDDEPPSGEPPPPVDFPPPRAAPLEPPLPPPPPPARRARRYGDEGTSELSLALGYSSQSGWLAGGGYRHYFLDGVAPGVEASLQSADGQTLGLLLASVRLVPLRQSSMALVVTGRAGRVLLSGHDDGWGAGGGVGLIFFLSPNVGVEIGYDVLWLLPSGFCADLSSCSIRGPELGLRVAF